MTDRPLVSVCMPAYNAEHWIAEAIESALAQTWTDFELVISDNASTDSTVEIARSYDDPRIRISVSDRNVGHIANHSRVIRMSTGTYIKFLHADDILASNSIEEQIGIALEDERVGLVFSPRELRVYDGNGIEWARMKTRQHERFGRLERNNDGRVLFFQMLGAGFDDNWIGEPTAVLLRRSSIERCGFFNPRIVEAPDLELYLRILLRYRVGFVDQPLCVHREHQESWTAFDRRPARKWLDSLWTLEGLLAEDAVGPTWAAVYYLRRKALRRALRAQIRRLAKRQFSGELVSYLRYRALSRRGRAPTLHEQLDPVPADGEGTSTESVRHPVSTST